MSNNGCNDVVNGILDLVRPNDQNEYDVAEGISAPCFRVIMVFIFELTEILPEK